MYVNLGNYKTHFFKSEVLQELQAKGVKFCVAPHNNFSDHDPKLQFNQMHTEYGIQNTPENWARFHKALNEVFAPPSVTQPSEEKKKTFEEILQNLKNAQKKFVDAERELATAEEEYENACQADSVGYRLTRN